MQSPGHYGEASCPLSDRLRFEISDRDESTNVLSDVFGPSPVPKPPASETHTYCTSGNYLEILKQYYLYASLSLEIHDVAVIKYQKFFKISAIEEILSPHHHLHYETWTS